MLDKLLFKAVHRGGKEFKLFALRNVDVGKGCDNMKSMIRKQLQDDIVESDFDVGMDNGGKVISLRTQAAIMVELWSDIQRGKNCQIWFDGLKFDTDVNATVKDSRRQVTGSKREAPESAKKDSKASKKKGSMQKTENRRKLTTWLN